MRHLSGALWKRLEAGERAVLVTVLKTVGSVPRTTGAAMALFADGTMAGTVGGGAVEFAALETAHGPAGGRRKLRQDLFQHAGRGRRLLLRRARHAPVPAARAGGRAVF